ncbi:hypothetical protein [Streptomyces sp. NPDC020141]|uniref:hypothetical protein n=1 Tax=Streptomyces sp. NPDC020141 TaxID=3365065 RepID=UPI0037B471AE
MAPEHSAQENEPAAEPAAQTMQAAPAAHEVPQQVWAQIKPVATHTGSAHASLEVPAAEALGQIAAAPQEAAPHPADPQQREFRRPAQ